MRARIQEVSTSHLKDRATIVVSHIAPTFRNPRFHGQPWIEHDFFFIQTIEKLHILQGPWWPKNGFGKRLVLWVFQQDQSRSQLAGFILSWLRSGSWLVLVFGCFRFAALRLGHVFRKLHLYIDSWTDWLLGLFLKQRSVIYWCLPVQKAVLAAWILLMFFETWCHINITVNGCKWTCRLLPFLPEHSILCHIVEEYLMVGTPGV